MARQSERATSTVMTPEGYCSVRGMSVFVTAQSVDMPLLFLDFDDVICLNDPYGGYDVMRAAHDEPADLWTRLFHKPCVEVLLAIVREHGPRVVITSSWLRFLDRQAMDAVLERTGLAEVKDALHDVWDAPQMRQESRLSAIERWLSAHLQDGDSLIVIDDKLSGTGLAGSRLEKSGRVVWCSEGVGLTSEHLEHVRRAFQRI
jgi:hypothetical protein